MAAKRLAVLTLALLAGCGGDRAASMAADSLSRDLQRLPVDSSAVLNDQAAATPAVSAQPDLAHQLFDRQTIPWFSEERKTRVSSPQQTKSLCASSCSSCVF